jgi:hypothetical protein
LESTGEPRGLYRGDEWKIFSFFLYGMPLARGGSQIGATPPKSLLLMTGSSKILAGFTWRDEALSHILKSKRAL